MKSGEKSKERKSLLDEQQEIAQKIGNRYKQLREAMNLSQEKFANEFGLDRRHLSRIENGASNMKIDTLVEYIRPFNISLKEFFQHLPD